MRLIWTATGMLAALAVPLAAQDASAPQPYVDFGNTAWVLIATAMVMLMLIPALAFFYGGLVKRKNVLNVLMQCFITLAVVTVVWVVAGYSMSFGPGNSFVGGLQWAFLNGVGAEPSPYYISQPTARIPHLLFMAFQLMFAAITPALIVGAFAERMKFSTFLVFTVVWSLAVYAPIAHWLWSAEGWLYKMGALDFAGGLVVHTSAGMASLATVLIIGRRKNLKPLPPHNLAFTMLGAALLWFGWFGFNAGSSLAADGLAANAFVVTNVAAAVATLTWAALDWFTSGKPTMLGVVTGAIAGLATITPGAGFVDVKGAIVIGMLASVVCYIFVMKLKPRFGYDDALDAFGVHGVGGIIGTLCVGVFATPAVQSAYQGLLYGNARQLGIQALALAVTAVYAFVLTWVIYKLLDLTMGVRVTEREEAMGLDVTQHNERAYTILE